MKRTEFLTDVYGVPASKGSYRALTIHGKSRLVPMDRKEKPWRKTVAETIRQEWDKRGLKPIPKDTPVILAVVFYLPRPKTVTRPYLTVKPDVDKLLRCVMDGITDSGVWSDDSQVCEASAVKGYADTTPPSARVSIEWYDLE